MNLDLLNKVMLAKQFWRIIDNPDRISSQVIIKKYGKGSIEFLSDKIIILVGNGKISYLLILSL